MDIGQDYSVSQWGDIMILACNTDRSEVLKLWKEPCVKCLGIHLKDEFYIQESARPGHCTDKSCPIRHGGAGGEGEIFFTAYLFQSKREIDLHIC